jgi:ketosteroid isomerase-like protein
MFSGAESAYGRAMTSSTTTTTSADAEIAVVRSGFEAFGTGDVAGFAAMFHPDATWNHRNPDRLGGVHAGIDAIMGFLKQSGELTAGTLRAVPGSYLAGGEGLVAVPTRVSGTRPDGRRFDDSQILLFAVEDDRVRGVDQYVGDPDAVTAFWD